MAHHPFIAVNSPLGIHPRQHIAGALLLGLMIAFGFEWSSWDVALQSLWFDPTIHQFPYRDHPFFTRYLHQGLRDLNAVLGVIAFIVCMVLARRHSDPFMRLANFAAGISLLAIPLIIGMMKSAIPRECPWSLALFGGLLPYQSLGESLRHWSIPSRGERCFPAGHASGGYMWLSWAIIFWHLQPQRARLSLLWGLIIGSIMGVAQMMRGAHFLSHTLWTIVITWLLSALIWWGSLYWRSRIIP